MKSFVHGLQPAALRLSSRKRSLARCDELPSTPNAEEDYDVVIRNLAERAGGWRWSLDLEERLLDALARHPGLGYVREDLLPRRICFYNDPPYQVLYLPETKPLMIIGIFHGARDIAALMSTRPDE